MTVKQFRTRRMPVAKLAPYANNARTHSEEQVSQVASSILEFGFTNPVLIDEDNTIVAGHCRVMAAERIGLDKVPCVILAGLTEVQRKAYVLADNRLALNAGWDDEKLALELEALEAGDFDLSLVGFTDTELRSYLDASDDAEEEGAPPAAPVIPTSRQGDLWILGNHRLLCGDSADADTVARCVGTLHVDQLQTDPPIDDRDDEEYLTSLTAALSAAAAVMKPGATLYIWHTEAMALKIRQAINGAELHVEQSIIWRQGSCTSSHQDYQWQHEPCLYGWKPGAAHLWSAERRQTSVVDFDKPKQHDSGCAVKPVDLIAYQIENNTRGDDVVLDLFGGTGTTLIACERTRRQARLIELDPRFVDVIVMRWEAETGRAAALEGTDKVFADVVAERGQSDE